MSKPLTESQPRRPPCVLVVDDNPANLEFAAETLEDLGVGPVLVAISGTEAVALAIKQRPDLVLMDLQMPEPNGFEATREIRRLEQEQGQARVPVVAFTSSTDVDPRLLRECGFDGVLDKSCDPSAMLGCLQRWCPPDGA